jgi:hypothetical protein
MSILKRQRELKKAEKAAAKRARRHGHTLEPAAEPRPTVGAADFEQAKQDAEAEPTEESTEATDDAATDRTD